MPPTVGGAGTVDVSRPPDSGAIGIAIEAASDLGFAVLLVLTTPVILIVAGSFLALPLWAVMAIAGRL